MVLDLITNERIIKQNKAADEMLLSRWYKQTPKRAKELSDIIRALKGS
jgi:hypothetical protein